MGRLSRMVSLDPRTRRLRLPTEFLEIHGLASGTPLHTTTTSRGRICFFTRPQWKLLLAALPHLVPETGIDRLAGTPVTLGSQGRLVLPRSCIPEAASGRMRFHYHIEGGILVLEPVDPEHAALLTPTRAPVPDRAHGRPPDAPATSPPQGLETPRGDPLSIPGPVEPVPLAQIKGVDPDLPETSPDPILAERIAEDGMTSPVVLCGPRPYRVVDGLKRIRVARYLEMESVPAVIFSRLPARDVRALRYLLEQRSDGWALARRIRELARLRRNGVSLDELSRLARKSIRTIQRYLRVAERPDLVEAIERGELSLREAEQRMVES